MLQTHRVAVKTVNLLPGDTRAKEILQEEVHIMSTLHHPNVAHVFGLVDEDDHQALVMQHYKRNTLAEAMLSSWFTTLDKAGRLKLAHQVNNYLYTCNRIFS
jgi:serine/threonine protein kinase